MNTSAKNALSLTAWRSEGVPNVCPTVFSPGPTANSLSHTSKRACQRCVRRPDRSGSRLEGGLSGYLRALHIETPTDYTKRRNFNVGLDESLNRAG